MVTFYFQSYLSTARMLQYCVKLYILYCICTALSIYYSVEPCYKALYKTILNMGWFATLKKVGFKIWGAKYGLQKNKSCYSEGEEAA